jgi:hypothetical protein
MIAIVPTMTPAAHQRSADPHRITEHFVTLSSRFVTSGMVALLLGMTVDVYLVSRVITESEAIAAPRPAPSRASVCSCGSCSRSGAARSTLEGEARAGVSRVPARSRDAPDRSTSRSKRARPGSTLRRWLPAAERSNERATERRECPPRDAVVGERHGIPR